MGICGITFRLLSTKLIDAGTIFYNFGDEFSSLKQVYDTVFKLRTISKFTIMPIIENKKITFHLLNLNILNCRTITSSIEFSNKLIMIFLFNLGT